MSLSFVKLGEVVKFIGGSQPPKTTFIFEEREGYIRMLQIRDYKSDRFKTYIPIDKARRFCTKEEIMIGRYGPPIFQILRGLEGAYNVALMKAEPSEKVDRNYLYHFLKQEELFKLLDGLSQRTAGQSGIDIDALKSYPMYLPSLKEQKRIASILDKADGIRRKRKQAINLTDQLLQSIFLDMFGDPVTNPKGWEIRKFGELVDNLDGKRIPVKSAERKKMSGEYPYYGASGIIDYVDDFIFNDEALLISEDGANLLARSTLIAFIVRGKYWVNNHAHVLSENGKAKLQYLKFSINLRSIKEYITGSAQPKLNQGMLNKIPIPNAPFELQQKFEGIVNKREAIIEKYTIAQKGSEDLFSSLTKNAFSGELIKQTEAA